MLIAMWSGPRNLSTAMMYAFAARGDCAVMDEPFYAAYLAATGLDHPMRKEILTSQPTDPGRVVAGICGSDTGEKPHLYAKLMTHHMLPSMPRDWMKEAANVFLIRHPARVVASYAARREGPVLDDLGFRQQAELYEYLRAEGRPAVVIDSADIRADPADALQKLCAALGLDWRPSMLRWPAGGHASDGVWARHWYGAVHRSTGFAGPEGGMPPLATRYQALADAALPYYRALHAERL